MKRVWTIQKLQEEALKHNTRGDFKKSNFNAYQSARRRNLLDKICNHMKILRKKPYTLEILQNIAKEFKTRGEFQHKNAPAYGAALTKKVLNEICMHMPPPLTEAYSVEEIEKEALKFKTRKSFQMGSPAYKAAWRRNILDQVCSHMPKNAGSGENNGRFKWKNTDILLEALKFSSRSDFKIGNPKAYDVAVRRGLMDEICAHMKKSGNVSKPELELFGIIKQKYPSTTTYRKRDVKIDGKPYIKGFYLDILVGNKGIEFDGDWHHSFEGLKRARKNRGWSDEDIGNYHKMKNEWFKSKGIEILHIKWTDWIVDKQSCIQKCLKFLSTQSYSGGTS